MSTKIFGREYKLTVATFDVSALRVQFDITKTLKPTPNTCEIKLYNLTQEHRNELATPKKLPVRLQAGYKGALAQLYLGEVRRARSVTEGSDVITYLSTADSEDPLQKTRLHRPVGAGASPADVLPMLVAALGVGEGNAKQMVAKLRARGAANVYGKRAVLSGHAAQELTDFCRSAGIEWSIQDGRLQFLDLNKPLEGTAVELSADTGLVGSPTVDSKGLAEAKCAMIPLLQPGRKVAFNSEHLKGGYRIIQAKYNGDSHGEEWHTTITCKKY